jgi:hypothetical protein
MSNSIFYEAIHKFECPKCGAYKGCVCVMPSGRRCNKPHKERVKMVYKYFDILEKSLIKFKEIRQ